MSTKELISFFTDVEGNIEYFHNFVSLSKVIYYKDAAKTELDLHPDTIFVFGGDVCDKGNGSIRITKQLIALKKKYPERVIFILGNRDINKMRYTSELVDEELRDWKNVPGPYWVKEDIRVSPKIYLTKLAGSPDEAALEKLNTLANRVRWMLDSTMGSVGDFERRREELKIITGKDYSDEEVARDFIASVEAGGYMREFLFLGQLAYIHEESIFVHGGITPSNFGYVPFKKERITDVKKWAEALNDWIKEELNDWVKNPHWKAGRRNEFPPPLDKFDESREKWACRGGQRAMDYVVPGTKDSVIYTHMFDNVFNFQYVDSKLAEKLNAQGIRRIVVGHQPHGYAPSVMKDQNIEVIAADTSYSDMKKKDNRGCAVSEVLIHGKDSSVRGVVATGQKIDYTLSLNKREGDPFVGRNVPYPENRKWWVKAKLAEKTEDGNLYVLSYVNGFEVQYAYVSYDQLAKLPWPAAVFMQKILSVSSGPSSIVIHINNKLVEVKKSCALPTGTSLEDVVNTPLFRNWVKNVQPDVFVKSVDIQGVDRLGPLIRFIKVQATITAEGHNLPGIIFMRGDSVAVFAVLTDPKTHKKFVIVVRHPRAAIGQFGYYEIPVVMDIEGEPFVGVVRNLIEDEVGIDITASPLINLNKALYKDERKIYLSPGASDEGLTVFLVECEATTEQIASLKKKREDKSKYTAPSVIELHKIAEKSHDAKTVIALQLYEHYVQQRLKENNTIKINGN